MRSHGESPLAAFLQAQARGGRRFGAYVAHAGAVLIIAAIAVSSTMGSSKEVQLNRGESAMLGRYQVTFAGAEELSEPHRQSIRARMEISRNGRDLGMLYPRMNYYENQREPVGSPAVYTGLAEDLYLSIHNIDPQAGTVGLLVLINPMVCWIWVATAIMALGGLIALVPAFRAAPAPAPSVSPVAMEGSS
jgi:cytochrome c-type biogenesis protein CcmF